jgi:hypothetical protein
MNAREPARPSLPGIGRAAGISPKALCGAGSLRLYPRQVEYERMLQDAPEQSGEPTGEPELKALQIARF